MTMESLPSILHRVIAGGKLSDIEFLSIKAFETKTRTNEGSRTTTGSIATLTANASKDMYIGSVKISCGLVIDSSTAGWFEAQLVVNGIVRETGNVVYNSAVQVADQSYEFKWRGFVTTGQTITINCSRAIGVNNTEISGSLECFEETTGASPQVPAI